MLRGRSAAAVGALTLTLVTAACSSVDDTGRSGSSEVNEPPVAVRGTAAASALHGTPLDPPLPRPSQVLRDTAGERFSLADRPADELNLLFFGYTHCPDVCPTTMADLASARSQLPTSLRNRVTVIFVTEDPERDTPRALRRWLDGFDPSFVGLRGGNQATKAMLDQLYLPRTTLVEKPEDPIEHPDNGAPHHHHGDYGVEHAGVVYAFAPGQRTVIYSGDTKPSEYAADFTQLLRGPAGG